MLQLCCSYSPQPANTSMKGTISMDSCSTLGHSFERKGFDASDMTPENGWVVDRPANCLYDGKGYFRCTICNRARSGQVRIPHTGHKWPKFMHRNVDFVLLQTSLNDPDAEPIPVYLCTNDNCPGCAWGGSDDAEGEDPYSGKAYLIAWDEIELMQYQDDLVITGFEYPEESMSGSQKDCAVNGHSFEYMGFDEDDRTPENGWVEDRPADCLYDGSGHFECTVCHIATSASIRIPATGHNWSKSSIFIDDPYDELIEVHVCTNPNCPGNDWDKKDGADGKLPYCRKAYRRKTR